MFGWEYAPIVSGGLGVVCRYLSESLVNQGVSLSFVLPKMTQRVQVKDLELLNASETEVDQELLQKVEVKSMLSPYLTQESFQNMMVMLKRRKTIAYDEEIYGFDLFNEVERYALQAYKIASLHKHDVIHAHDWMTFPAAVNAKKISGKPLFVHIHATEYDRTADQPSELIVKYEKTGMQAADKVIAVSERTKERIIAQYGIPSEKIEVVHNAIEAKFPEPQVTYALPKTVNDEKIVLFLARLSVQKGADYLLRSAQKVLKKMKNVKFVFVGKGNMLPDLINMSIDLGITENVIFTGFMTHDQVDQAYKKADLFVMPSISEPFGITALEAIKNGTPVLMSKQSGASEVITNCLKVDFWDIDEMANKILAVLKHQPLANTLTENGFNDLERISWDKQALKVIELYNSALH